MRSAWLLLFSAWALPAAAQGTGAVAGRVRLTGRDSGLANVLVWVSAGLPAGAKYQAPRAPVAVTIVHGRFAPRVVAIAAGQPVELRNSDATPRRVSGAPTGDRPFTVELSPSGGSARRYFSATTAPMRIETAGDSCAVAWVAVMRHPFFAVTGSDGRFAISNLRPGTYTITAWHERLGTRTATVTVTAAERQALDFSFRAR